MTPLIFVHGWGLAPDLWTPVIARMDGYERHAVNLGFRGPVTRAPLPSNPIVIGHSMGFGWALQNIPQPWSHAVAINGFSRFTRSPDFPQGVDARIASRMLTRLRSDPTAVVADFLGRAGMRHPNVADLQPDALTRHLTWLAEMDVRPLLANLACPLLALCGAHDAIVPPALSEASFAPQHLEWIEDGDHMAPLTHPDLIASRLRRLAAGQ